MIKFGKPPYLEASSKGDKRFSAFYARIGNRSIEEIYQAAKIFKDGSTNLSWKEAKGKKAVNMDYVSWLYEQLWRTYIKLNPHLLDVLKQTTGISDMFGKPNCQCQAEILWRMRNEILTTNPSLVE